ncbi:MAG TPA: hypothetical protein VG012_05875 [Acidimicrobiia bacterium]|jgi:hypothetical protein|nr:hypothetical protein [Acidimicrobiia bacterium]
MAALAEDLTLLLLSADDTRDLGYQHGDPTRNAVGLAFLVEPWVDGGPPPTADTIRRELPRTSSAACERALDPLVGAGRVEQQRASSRLGRVFQKGQAKRWRVVDRAGRQAVFERVAASLGGTTPPSRPDATLAVLLWASGTWDRSGLDGPLPMPYVSVGADPQPWGPLGAGARALASGTAVPAGETDPGVLPLLARALSLGDLVTRLDDAP